MTDNTTRDLIAEAKRLPWSDSPAYDAWFAAGKFQPATDDELGRMSKGFTIGTGGGESIYVEQILVRLERAEARIAAVLAIQAPAPEFPDTYEAGYADAWAEVRKILNGEQAK